jgi:hydrogenase maturation factor
VTNLLSSAFGPACTHDSTCITCGDTAVAMQVVELQGDSGLARCRTEDGEEELVETELVAPVRPGDELLVHAATAIQTIRAEGAGA